MGTLKFNKWQDVNGNQQTTVLQTKITNSATYTSVSAVQTWTEVSTDYRVSITPRFTNSLIIIQYYLPINIYTNGANCLKLIRGFRIVGGGSKDYALSSRGTTQGSRHAIAGHAFRKLNGYDYNDQQAEHLLIYDAPNTTSAVTYGFEYYQESSASSTDYFGYSNDNNGTWGYSSRIIIVAQEIAQ